MTPSEHPEHSQYPGLDALLRARAAHESYFGTAPHWAASAPGRINLIGEHIDYSGGHVLPIACQFRCACVASPAAAASTIWATDVQRGDVSFTCDVTGDLRSAASAGTWASYIAGVLHFMREIARLGGASPANLQITLASDVPIGAGLSSSAALEVSTAMLLQAAWGFRIEATELAVRCRRAEHEFAGVPCGIMDQYISAMGHESNALLINCATGRARLVPLPEPDRAAILVFDTHVRHALGQSEYPKRREASDAAAAALGLKFLCAADPTNIETATLTDEQRRCARHAVSENARTLEAAHLLTLGDLAGAGRLMTASHRSLREDYRVSCPELDAVVELATHLPGVYGARMTGGGFGGCVVALVEPSQVDCTRRALHDGYAARCGRPGTSWVVTASNGATIERG